MPIERQYFDRRVLKNHKLNLNYLKRIFISCSRLFKITERLSPQENNVLSSVNLHISDFSINKKISLIKILKSRGPGIDPWRIP